jgi:hypothetical protein
MHAIDSNIRERNAGRYTFFLTHREAGELDEGEVHAKLAAGDGTVAARSSRSSVICRRTGS